MVDASILRVLAMSSSWQLIVTHHRCVCSCGLRSCRVLCLFEAIDHSVRHCFIARQLSGKLMQNTCRNSQLIAYELLINQLISELFLNECID